MDVLQVALVLLILLLGIMLSILGFQVFLILKDLRRSLDKLDTLFTEAGGIAEAVEQPVKAVAEVVNEKVKEAAAKSTKPQKRLFKRG